MAQTLTPKIEIKLTGTRQNVGDLETANVTLAKTITHALTNGTSDKQADVIFSDTRTLTTGANETLNLAGSLVDSAFGSTLTFVNIKAIMIFSKLDANRVLTVGGAASNGFATPFGASTDTIKINPGGSLVLIAPNTGYAVTAGTGDLLKIANASGGSTTYDIIIIGTSA